MTSPLFSKDQKHKFVHGEKAAAITPSLDSYKIIFNDRDDVEYWMTVKHQVS